MDLILYTCVSFSLGALLGAAIAHFLVQGHSLEQAAEMFLPDPLKDLLGPMLGRRIHPRVRRRLIRLHPVPKTPS
jgi:hypothetical protein